MVDILERVRLAGVVGAGGAGFPTHAKLKSNAEMVIVNAAECEPMLRVDQQLIVREYSFLLSGLVMAMNATGAGHGVIAIKKKHHVAIEVLMSNLPENVTLHFLPDIYPAGDELVIVHEVTGKIVPPGGLPINVGVVVNNVQTLINIGKALEDEPVIKRTITVTGWVNNPVTLSLPIGTALTEALKLAGGAKGERAGYIIGGPVMGSILRDLSLPITKTSGGLIVLPENHPLIRQKNQAWENILIQAKSACLQCSFCTELCPRHMLGHNLSPHLIMRAINYGGLAKTEDLLGSLICSECGVCEVYACPSGLSPRRVNAMFKQKLRVQGVKYSGKQLSKDPIGYTRQVPISRLVKRLGLEEFNHPAPYLETDFEPKQVIIPLKQHIGMTALPIVKRGQVVAKGELIGEVPEGQLGARVHASISGKIKKVSKESIVIRAERGGA